jgi:type IV pilus assembly protein PilQ
MKILKVILLFLTIILVHEKCYGENINLTVQEAPVSAVLQNLAKIHHVNLVLNESITGHITLHLENVPWQQALDIILQDQGLTAKKIDNVLIILPIEEMTKREENLENLNNIMPLQTLTFNLHYAKAQEVAVAIKNQNKSLLSSRGNITADVRTNSLFIEDVSEKLNDLKKYIQHIDVPVKQVLIEARIVTVDEKHEKELGVRFGVTRPGNNLSGSLAGANQLAQNINPANVDPLSRLNVDLPANNPLSGRIAVGLANIGKGNLLDLELSALESEGFGQIISSPRLITADQQPATILSGQEIPYQQKADYGTTSIAFQKAVLSLTVTPQITPNNQLLLTLQLNQDRPTTTLIQGVPEIDTREIKTQVLVKNAQTIVLGGIYEQTENHQLQKVPFFGNLPLIGRLFQHDFKQRNRQELLIFVTPSVVSLDEKP